MHRYMRRRALREGGRKNDQEIAAEIVGQNGQETGELSLASSSSIGYIDEFRNSV